MAIPFVKECDLGCGRPVEILYQGAIYDIAGAAIFPIPNIDEWKFYGTVWSFCFDCCKSRFMSECQSGDECIFRKEHYPVVAYTDFYAGSCLYCWNQAALILLEQRKERKQ